MAKKPAAPKAESVDFEQALNELEGLVERLEQGELSLDQSLKDFERGIELTRLCQQSLLAAEQRVQMLTRKGAKEQLVPFDDTADEDA